MADSTSVGKVQLDIEINQKSINTELNRLNKTLSGGFNNSFKSMFSGMASQMNGFVKDSIGKMNSGFRNFTQSGASANEKVSQSVKKMNTEYEKTETKIKEIRDELAKLFAEQDAIATKYDGMPNIIGMSKDESMEQMLKSDTGYQRLSAEIDKLTAKMDPLIHKNKTLAEEIKVAGDNAQNTGKGLSFLGRNTNKAGKDAEKATLKTKFFGDEMKKSGVKATGFAHMLSRSFRRIIRRIFVLNLMYKMIRAPIQYIGEALNANKEFARSLQIVRTNLRVAFQPIYDFILPALNALMQGVAKVTTYIASAISALFGKSYQQSFSAAKGLEASKKAMDGYGKSAKKASGALAGFDEINQLDISNDEDSEGSSGGFEMVMPDTSSIDLTGFEVFMDKLKTMFEPTMESLERFKTGLEPLKTFVATGLEDFYNNFLVPVGNWTIGEGLPRFIDAITVGLLGVNWQVINDGLSQLWSVLTPFAANVGEGLLWFWENVLTPLGTWTMNNVVPIFLDMLSEAFGILNGVIEFFKPLAQWLWDSFLKPIAEWTGGIIVSVLEGLRDALQSIGDWISNNQTAVENMAIAIGSFMAAWLIVDLATKIGGIVTVLSTFVTTGGLATGATTLLKGAIGALTSPAGIAVIAIGGLITIGILLYKNWDKVSVWLKNTWEGIKTAAVKIFNVIKSTIVNIFNSIKTIVTNIWGGITTGLTKAFNDIYDGAVSIFNRLKDFIKGVTDSIGGFFKGMVNGVIRALNSMIGGLNRINVDIPDWVPGLGGKSLGFNIANIPMLAKGGIIDQPTLAMVGERGKEAVVPLENNTEWMEKLASILVSALMGVMQFGDTLPTNESGDIILQIDGTTFARIVGPYLDKENLRIGNVVLQPI